jgi:hypothetical protein
VRDIGAAPAGRLLGHRPKSGRRSADKQPSEFRERESSHAGDNAGKALKRG